MGKLRIKPNYRRRVRLLQAVEKLEREFKKRGTGYALQKPGR
jgi:hypothetical protein